MIEFLVSVLALALASPVWASETPFSYGNIPQSEDAARQAQLARDYEEWQKAPFGWMTALPVNSLFAPVSEEATGTDDIFHKVTNTFGPLYVRPGKFEAGTSIKPWSSWWYPIWDDFLFNPRDGQEAPLQRYDRYEASRGINSSAADYEKTNLYQPRAADWAGLCDAWALASIMVPEPKNPVTRDGITFRVSDQKALILKTFEGVQGLDIFGQRYDGKWDSDFQDIYPDQFHRFLQVELFQKKMPFFMDTDPGVEVWNAPVYHVTTTITADSKDPTVMHVETWVTTASSRIQSYDYVGTDSVDFDYTYDLHGETLDDGRFLVSNGEWTARSRWDHPDFVTERPNPARLVRKSFNTQIDPAAVDTIVYGRSAIGRN